MLLTRDQRPRIGFGLETTTHLSLFHAFAFFAYDDSFQRFFLA
jgi:hypothetical protein